MQLVVPNAVRKAVRAATRIFTAISTKLLFFIIEDPLPNPSDPLPAPPLGGGLLFPPIEKGSLRDFRELLRRVVGSLVIIFFFANR
jgi:hypothetical protein